MLLSLYPQFNLWLTRGHSWSGAYAYNDIDEVAYAAYLNALIEGRPRRNDPYMGRDDEPGAPQAESLFSIQFIPPYATALAARTFGLSTSSVMIWLVCLSALASALVIFWLLAMVTGDDRIAATGALIVLCLGALACGQGAVEELFGAGPAYPYFPFLRRYIPALPFPFFFLFCALIWRAIMNVSRRALLAVLAGMVFAFLVFSYFYLWTTALAWLACVALLWLAVRPDGWQRDVKLFAITGSIAIASLLPYSVLLSHRAATMDSIQLLTNSHAPDLFRPPEVIGIVLIAVLMWAIRRGKASWRDRTVLFTVSLALTPMIVFNQQIITGHSLQPIHYEVFIANYVSLVALVLTSTILLRSRKHAKRIISNLALATIALAVIGWGAFEAKLTALPLNEQNLVRDDALLVARKLAELEANSTAGRPHPRSVVLATNLVLGDELPSVTPQAVLWARHLHIFSGATSEESKERFYQHMYYSGLSEKWLSESLNEGNFVVVFALFGWGRSNDRLTVNPAPLTPEEINAEVRHYSEYAASFTRARATNPTLSYVVTYADDEPDFSNLDKWYQRDDGVEVGSFTLYRVKLRE